MDKERINEMLSIALGIMSVIAIVGLLIKNNFDTNELLGSIVNFTQVAIPVLVLFIASSIKNKSKNYIDAGKEALENLRKRNETVLQGPEFDKTDYNPEETAKSQRMQYLFFTKYRYAKKVAFIPLEPIEQGILDIRVSKATLVNFGFDSKDSQIETLVIEAQSKIYSDLENFLSSKYSGLFEILNKQGTETKDAKYKNSAIVIDFDEEKLKISGLKKAVYNCSEKALQIILNYKK